MLRIVRLLSVSVLLGTGGLSVAQANSDTWKTGTNGLWETGTNWTDGSTPISTDSATVGQAGTYTIMIGTVPTAIQALSVNGGAVATMQSKAGAKTLSVNAAAGAQTLTLSGSGTTLNLGDNAGTNPLSLNMGAGISVNGGASAASLLVRSGSDVSGTSMNIGTASGDGTVTVDGSGSSLVLSNTSNLGSAGFTGSLTFQNSSSGSLAIVTLGAAANGGIGNVSVLSGSMITAMGSLVAGTGGIAGQSGTVTMDGTSSITQTGGASITVGAASLSTGGINIGTANSGATFTTGSGLLTINQTGAVNIGTGAITGTLNANGNITIDGGTLTQNNSGSSFNWASGKTLTVQNGGSLILATSFTTPANSIVNVSGQISNLQTSGATSALIVNNSGQVNVSGHGGANVGFLDIGTSGTGTLSIDGHSSLLAMAGLGASNWGLNGGTANVTIANFSHLYIAMLNVVNTSAAGTTAIVNVQSGGDLYTGPMNVGTGGGSTSATVNITGQDSILVIGGTLTVGHPSTGTAAINVGTTSTSGALSIGAGLFTINKTGIVTIGSGANVGTLLAGGDINVDGGQLTFNSAGSGFNWDVGKTMTIQNGGVVTLVDHTTPANAIYQVSGSNSKLAANGAILFSSGTQMHVSGGGQVTTVTGLIVGNGGIGTLTVDGQGSAVSNTSTSSIPWGANGGTANVTFSGGATGTFNNVLNMAGSSTAGTTANANVLSGAHLTALANLVMANQGGATTSATLTVSDANSQMAVNGTFILGHAASGSATLNVNHDAMFSAANTTLNATGQINIDGGQVFLGALTFNGGAIHFNSGLLVFNGNLTVGPGGLLGTDVTLGPGKFISLPGSTTVNFPHALTLSGGSLVTGSLGGNGAFNFTSGRLDLVGVGGFIVGNGGPLGFSVSLGAGKEIDVSFATNINSAASLSIDGGSFFPADFINSGNFNMNSGQLFIGGTLTNQTGAAFQIRADQTANATGVLNNSGEVLLGGGTAILAGGSTLANSGLLRGDGRINKTVTNNAGGEIRAESGKRIQFLGANGANAGQINLQGGTAEFSQALTNGATGQIIGRGTLKVGGAGLTNLGNIALASGITDIFGDVNNNSGSASKGIAISGGAAVNFWDDVTNTSGLFKVNSGSTANFFGAFSGNGITGSANDIHFESDISPGFSPASITLGGNVSLGAAAKLKIELGGTTPGMQFDQLHVSGQFSLDGTLDVVLYNGFKPVAGNTFDLLDWTSLSGTFGTVNLPTLNGRIVWDSSHLYDSGALGGTLSVLATYYAGDINRDGRVNVADISALMAALSDLSGYQSSHPELSGNPQLLMNVLDVNGDTHINNADIQGLIVLLANGGGSGGGSSSASGDSALTAVPEPTSLVLLGLGALAIAFRRRLLPTLAPSPAAQR